MDARRWRSRSARPRSIRVSLEISAWHCRKLIRLSYLGGAWISLSVSKSFADLHGRRGSGLQGIDSSFHDHMIRERVATNGVLRALETESLLGGCTLPIEKLGLVTETAVKRYLEGQALWDKKYRNVARKVTRDREHHLKLSKEHACKVLERIQHKLDTVRRKGSEEVEGMTDAGEGLKTPSESCDEMRVMLNSPLWTWSWALQGEDPPPSSIVARGDTVSATLGNPRPKLNF